MFDFHGRQLIYKQIKAFKGQEKICGAMEFLKGKFDSTELSEN
jgi:hypothetical protein